MKVFNVLLKSPKEVRTYFARAQITANSNSCLKKHFIKRTHQHARRRTSSAIAPARISSVLGSPGLKNTMNNGARDGRKIHLVQAGGEGAANLPPPSVCSVRKHLGIFGWKDLQIFGREQCTFCMPIPWLTCCCTWWPTKNIFFCSWLTWSWTWPPVAEKEVDKVADMVADHGPSAVSGVG